MRNPPSATPVGSGPRSFPPHPLQVVPSVVCPLRRRHEAAVTALATLPIHSPFPKPLTMIRALKSTLNPYLDCLT